jgi:hypothetical protein
VIRFSNTTGGSSGRSQLKGSVPILTDESHVFSASTNDGTVKASRVDGYPNFIDLLRFAVFEM